MTRYARQDILPQIGGTGRAALDAARVLVVGAGGLGVPVLHYLAGSGVGQITLVEGDTVSLSNLHRQPLYSEADIGRLKAEIAAQRLAALNSGVSLKIETDWLTPGNAPSLVAQADLVFDCADTFGVSFTLSDTCFAAATPLISASALGQSGYVGGFCAGAPSLRAVFPDLPQSAPTCDSAGVMGPVVGTLGAIMAQMGLANLLGQNPSPLGQMMVVDLARWRTSSFRFDGAPEPGRALPFIAQNSVRPKDLVIDLRTEAPKAFRADALHLDGAAAGALTPPPDTTRVVLACRTGLRALNTGEALARRWPGEIALIALPNTE